MVTCTCLIYLQALLEGRAHLFIHFTCRFYPQVMEEEVAQLFLVSKQSNVAQSPQRVIIGALATYVLTIDTQQHDILHDECLFFRFCITPSYSFPLPPRTDSRLGRLWLREAAVGGRWSAEAASRGKRLAVETVAAFGLEREAMDLAREVRVV